MNIYVLKYEENEEKLLPFLSEQRKKAVSKIKNPSVRREKIYSYALLCYALFRNFGITTPPVFTYGERGKPYLSGNPEICFSISHAGGRAACACGEVPLGLDIQDIRPLKADISAKICTPSELEGLTKALDKGREICRLWCIKESVGKLSGMGFAEGFTGIETGELLKNGRTFLAENDGFFVALTAENKLADVSVADVSGEELFKTLDLSFCPNCDNS